MMVNHRAGGKKSIPQATIEPEDDLCTGGKKKSNEKVQVYWIRPKYQNVQVWLDFTDVTKLAGYTSTSGS